jgi:hypothetical protein
MVVKKEQIGTTIFIPFTHSLFDNVWRVGENWLRRQNTKFITKFEKFKKLDKKDFAPIYYCYECQRLEDGCHRSWAMRDKGYSGYESLIGRICWTKMDKLHTRLVELIKKRKLSNKDVLWTLACQEKKWNELKKLDFSKKTYLDIGAQSGYSVFMGWNLGAIKAVGVELRKEIFDVAVEMKEKLNATETEFHNLDWTKSYPTFGQFDIVSCMGLMHYFPKAIYDAILVDLCKKAQKNLILELRVWPDNSISHMEKQKQTLISVKHMTDILTQNGFKIITQIDIPQRSPMTPGKRGLWVMEKI